MTRDEALKKIKKCLALAASANPHEAAAAMRQAQKLMEQFQVDATDPLLHGVNEREAKAPSASIVDWEAALARMVADAFGCELFAQGRAKMLPGLRQRKIVNYVFIGVGVQPECAQYAYAVLSRQCAKDRRAHIGKQPKNCLPKTRVARGDTYAMGWLAGCKSKLQAFANTPEDAAAIAAYKEDRCADMADAKPKNRTSGKNIKPTDFFQGHSAGKTASLHHGVAGGQPQALIGSSK